VDVFDTVDRLVVEDVRGRLMSSTRLIDSWWRMTAEGWLIAGVNSAVAAPCVGGLVLWR
jgi:hypothetical protein